MIKMDVGIKGIQEMMAANQAIIAALSPKGVLAEEIRALTVGLHRYAVAITHVWHDRGGGLRASHRMDVTDGAGEIFIDPSTVNPRGQRPVEYGPFEHNLGGTHAFYQRTVDERGQELVEASFHRIGKILTAKVR
jgi:hypothetical protein